MSSETTLRSAAGRYALAYDAWQLDEMRAQNAEADATRLRIVADEARAKVDEAAADLEAKMAAALGLKPTTPEGGAS